MVKKELNYLSEELKSFNFLGSRK